MSRFKKKDVFENWRHERVPIDDPNHPFPGIMKAYGTENGREVSVYVSDFTTPEDPIPEVMGKYLLDSGIKQFDENGHYIGQKPFYVTKDEFFHLLGDAAKVFELQGIKLLIVLIGKLLRDKAEDLKGKTKKELIHSIIDQLGDKVESDILTIDNVSNLIDHMTED